MIKRCLFVLILLVSLAWIQSNNALAGGFEGPGVGARALHMGGAFVGLADDWTAFAWNPAGLAQLQGNGGGLSMDYVPAKASDGNSVANSIVPNADQKDVFANPYGNEPLKFNKTDVKSTVLLPTLGGYTRIKGLSVGGGVYVPMGYSSKWEDTVGTLTGTYEMEAYETIYDISVAKELIPNLSLGVSLNLISGRLEKHAKKTYGYEYTVDFEGDGSGFEGVIGGLYKLQPNLSIGLVYRTGSKITFDGSAKRIHTAAPSFNHQTDYEQVFRHPATLGLGIAYKPTNKLTLTTDWNQTDWSSQKDEITYTTQGTTPPFVNTNNESGWKDTNKIRLGGEYKLNTAWTLRAGFLTDPSPVPDKAVSLTNLIDLDRTFQTIGAGYSYGNWQFDFGCLHTKTDKTIDGVKYERSSDSINVASSYRF